MSSKKVDENIEKAWNAIFCEFTEDRNHILGKVLTIIDASITDEKQNKGIKDLIREAIWSNEHMEFRVAKTLLWLNDQEEGDDFLPYNYKPKVKTTELFMYRDK